MQVNNESFIRNAGEALGQAIPWEAGWHRTPRKANELGGLLAVTIGDLLPALDKNLKMDEEPDDLLGGADPTLRNVKPGR